LKLCKQGVFVSMAAVKNYLLWFKIVDIFLSQLFRSEIQYEAVALPPETLEDLPFLTSFSHSRFVAESFQSLPPFSHGLCMCFFPFLSLIRAQVIPSFQNI
jgi:hypothetical protein